MSIIKKTFVSAYHNDNEPSGPCCLMDAGAYRPFYERTELGGAEPGSWCGDEGPYLETVLPVE